MSSASRERTSSSGSVGSAAAGVAGGVGEEQLGVVVDEIGELVKQLFLKFLNE